MAFQEMEPSSSPDPLSLCDENQPSPSPLRARTRRSNITPRKPLVNVSGNAAIQDFYIATPTPTKGKSRSKGNTDTGSPWRIRLTVQADQVNTKLQEDAATAISSRVKEHTVTTRIPVKGIETSSPLDPRRSRERRRRVSTTTIGRNGTPKPDVNRRKKSPEKVSDTTEHIHMDEITPTKRRSRRSPYSAHGHNANLSASLNSQTSEECSEAKTKPQQPRSRTRRKEVTPKKTSEPFGRFSMSSQIVDSSRSQSQPFDAGLFETQSMDIHTLGTQSPQSDDQWNSQTKNEGRDIWSPVGRQDKGLQSALQTDETSAEPIADPTDEHGEFDSLLESEGFSMVSISSLPSAGLHSASPAEQNGGFPRGLEPKAQKYDAENISTISQAAHGYSDISSIAQDQPPFNFVSSIVHGVPDGQKTPTDVIIPQSPPAPKVTAADPGPRLWDQYEDGSAKISRVMRAGAALQKTLDSTNGSLQSTPMSQGTDPATHARSEKGLASAAALMQRSLKSTPEQPIEDPFAGFSGGTRRELRAGLRLGQELAKKRLRQSAPSKSVPAGKKNLAPRMFENMDSQFPAQHIEQEHEDPFKTSLVSYPVLPDQQLPSPAHTASDDEGRMSWKSNTPKLEAPVRPLPAPTPTGQAEDIQEASSIDHMMLAREAEWQREREAVSRQIEMANASQVIVIDSDDSSVDMNETEEPLQGCDSGAEAKKSGPESSLSPETETVGPQRQELPGPWKQSATAMDKSSPNSSECGLFWLPDDAREKATRRRHERRKRARDEDVAISSSPRCEPLPVASRISREPTSSILSRLVNDSAHDSSDASDDDACMETSHHSAEPITGLSTVPLPFANLSPPEDSKCYDDANLPQRHDHSTAEIIEKDVRYPSVGPAIFKPQTTPLKQPVSSTLASRDTSTSPKPTSWLSALTKPLTALFCAPPPNPSPLSSKPEPSLPPATKSDILSSSAPAPLSTHHPWTVPHFHALEPLYYAAHLYGAFIFPVDPDSPSARFLGTTIRTSTGWERKANEMDCGVTDAFMFLLSERSNKGHNTTQRPTRKVTRPSGTTDVAVAAAAAAPATTGTDTGAIIDEEYVLRMCVRIWADMVQRGDVDLQRERGEVAGLRRQGDRVWRAATDIQAADSRKEYFERKKKEWGGLPSWRRKGLVP